jgi:5-methylcytosine-specific restriction endonuclease McrA
MKIITRDTAKNRKLKRYFTGKPCKYGHIAERAVCNFNCIACEELKYPAKAQKSKEWRLNNPEKSKEGKKAYYQNNRTEILAKAEANYDPIKKREYQKKYYKKNKSRFIAYAATRSASKLKATPSWANLKAIREIYEKCPNGMEVDHIIPIKGKLVCGLHTENNLQYLSKEENSKKRNKFIPFSTLSKI